MGFPSPRRQTTKPDRALIEATVADTRSVLASLQQKRDKLRVELDELERDVADTAGRLARWEAILATWPPDAAPDTGCQQEKQE